MIDRYCRPEMAAVWADERRLALWLEVELAATRAREGRGEVPAGTVERIRSRTRIDLPRMLAIEAEVHHDVIAFLSMVAETAGDDARRKRRGRTWWARRRGARAPRNHGIVRQSALSRCADFDDHE